MEPPAVVFRLVVVALILIRVVQIAIALRRPPDWQPPRPKGFPVRTRNGYLVRAVLGIIGGLLAFALSFVIFP